MYTCVYIFSTYKVITNTTEPYDLLFVILVHTSTELDICTNYTCTIICICICTYIYVCVYIFVYIYTHIYVYAHSARNTDEHI